MDLRWNSPATVGCGWIVYSEDTVRKANVRTKKHNTASDVLWGILLHMRRVRTCLESREEGGHNEKEQHCYSWLWLEAFTF